MAVENDIKFCTNCNGTGQVKVISYSRVEAYFKPCPRCQSEKRKKGDRHKCQTCGSRFRRKNKEYVCIHCKESFCAFHKDPEKHDCPECVKPSEQEEKIEQKKELKCCDCGLIFTKTKESHTCIHCNEAFCVLHREPEKHTCPNYKIPMKKKLKRFYYNYIYSPQLKVLRTSKPLLKYSTLAFLLLALFQPHILVDNSPEQIDVLVQIIGSIKGIIIVAIKGILSIIGPIIDGGSGGSDTEYIPSETRQLMVSIPKPEYDNPYLIELVGLITKDCQSHDSACKTFMIHRYVQENFDYVYNPAKSHLNPAPETIKDKYGVCIDFAILYYNYLMATNVESYIVDSYGDDHAYAVACNLDLKHIENMWLDASRKWRSQYIIDNRATFEINRIWDKPCIHLEGPSSEKDRYHIDVRYPGEYIDYFIDPRTGAESQLGKNRYAMDPKAKRATKVAEILLVDSSWKGFKREIPTPIPTTTVGTYEAPEITGDYTTISFYNSVTGEYLDGEVYLDYSLYGETKNGEIKLYREDIPEKKQISKYIEPRITIGFKGLKGSNPVSVEWHLTKTELISSDHRLEL